MDQRIFVNGVKRTFIVPQYDEDHPGFCFLPRRCPNGTNDSGPADSRDRGRAGNSSQCSVFESSTRRTTPAVAEQFYRIGQQRTDSLSILLGIPAVFARAWLSGSNAEYGSIRFGHLYLMVAPWHQIASPFSDAGRKRASIWDGL